MENGTGKGSGDGHDHAVNVYLHFILLFLNVLNTIAHSFGTYLLVSVYKRTQQRVQRIFLINLSTTEAIMNLLEIIRIIPDLGLTHSNTFENVDKIRNCVLIVTFTGMYFVYYLDMIYITLDRLLDILLNIKYPIYCTARRARITIILTWIVGLTTCILEAVYYHFHSFSWEKVLFIYVYPPLQFSFLILALVTYGFIFHKYKQASHNPPARLHRVRRLTSWQLFRRSRFYISVLLIVTFTIFMIFPDVTYIILTVAYDIQFENHSELVTSICLICYAVSNLIDSFIYIFLEDKIRITLWRRCARSRRKIKHRVRGWTVTTTTTTGQRRGRLRKNIDYNNNVIANGIREAFFIPNIGERGYPVVTETKQECRNEEPIQLEGINEDSSNQVATAE